MSVTIKIFKEIELMREAGRLLELVHDELAKAIRPGNINLGYRPSGRRTHPQLWLCTQLLNYNGFPASICVSVNDEVVHGIPRKDRIPPGG